MTAGAVTTQPNGGDLSGNTKRLENASGDNHGDHGHFDRAGSLWLPPRPLAGRFCDVFLRGSVERPEPLRCWWGRRYPLTMTVPFRPTVW